MHLHTYLLTLIPNVIHLAMARGAFFSPAAAGSMLDAR